jgi:TIR domain
MVDQPRDFFISYTGRDEEWATWVAQQLELAGYHVVLQAWDFGAGNFRAHMEKAVQQAKWLIAILSEPYIRSEWGRWEWTAYLESGEAFIIPIQIEDTITRSMLRTLQRINLVGLGEQDAGKKLREKIAELAGPPSHGPLDRQDGKKSRFPGISYRISAGTAYDQDSGEAATVPVLVPVPVERNRIQLILLGAGKAAERVASFRRLLDIPDERCLDLFGSELSADDQLAELTELVKGLDPEAVSDVLVVVAGTGSKDSDDGVRLHVRATEPAESPTTSIGLTELLKGLQDKQHRLRSCVILDVVDGQGQPVGPTAQTAVPVLTLGDKEGGRGLARIHEELARPAEELTKKLPHWGLLSLHDLTVLAGGHLVAREGSPAYGVGLIPSPLAWPREGTADDGLASWCAVVSETDTRTPGGESVDLVVDKLAAQSRNRLNQAYLRHGYAIQLEPSPGKLRAGHVLSSPRSFAHAVEQVCRAELAIFDLTNFEPAVMILLGVRAVIRRGVTVCVMRKHDPPWQDAEPPFHLREVSLVKAPDRDAVEARILEGIRQLASPGSGYTDLPCFDQIRRVPEDPEQRKSRAFDAARNPAILALVPFDPAYVRRNWTQIKDSLPATARDEIVIRRGEEDGRQEEAQSPALQRTLDLDSPRLVSAQLFEAIRMTDFCLVDLTSARPNVLFELGVRLAANRLHPVVIVDPDYPAVDTEAGWLEGIDVQLRMLRRLLQPVQYSPTLLPAFTHMVERHVEFRRLLGPPKDPRADSLLGGLPLTGVYDTGWRHAVDRDEAVTMPVPEHLQSGGEAMLVDQTLGQRHLIYPTKHRLTDAAERTGREYLIAAWLYLHFRGRVNNGPDSEPTRRYHALTDKLLFLLDQTGDQADASFIDRMEQWQADEGSPAGQQTDGEHG